MYNIAISIVTFNNDCTILGKTLQSCLNADLKIHISIIDNSKNAAIKELCVKMNIEYIATLKNIGFGSGHNIAINKMLNQAEYHLILNPDVYFAKGMLEEMYSFAQDNKDIGLIIPKVLYSDNSIQYACKLLPNPFDFALRRLISAMPNLFFCLKKRDEIYELRFTGYDEQIDAPFLSGCFMCIRNEVFNKIGLFDTRFFMYLEDVDLSRRIHKYFRTVYYPKVSVCHEWEGGSRRNLKLLMYQIGSAIKYFNKWGWFFDKERRQINKKTLQQLKSKVQ